MDASGSIPAGVLHLSAASDFACPSWSRVFTQPRFQKPLPALGWLQSNPQVGLSRVIGSIVVQSHLPSVLAQAPKWNLLEDFCALTLWNVLSYRHCCRGIATVTSPVARHRWFRPGSHSQLRRRQRTPGCPLGKRDAAYTVSRRRGTLAAVVETPSNRRPHGIRYLEARLSQPGVVERSSPSQMRIRQLQRRPETWRSRRRGPALHCGR